MKMNNGILEIVKRLEAKNDIRYATANDIFYKILKVIYISTVCYELIINLLYMLSMYLNDRADTSQGFLAYIITPLVCSLLLIVGFIFQLKKINIAGAVLSVVPSIVLIFFFRSITYAVEANTLMTVYYWRHLAPALIISLTGFIMSFIAVRANIKLRKMYDKVVNSIYENYKVNLAEGGELSSEQWEEFLEKFDPYAYNIQFFKNIEQEDKQ
ncbi:MAG: hypothetical protein IJO62_01550 [Clostridia bacterium]|nr:hypothetical protein [Clostridia bacterium]